MEDTLHSSCSEDFVEREEEEKNRSEKTAERFLSENIAPKDQLGVPRDNGLVQVEEDGGRRALHRPDARCSQ